MTLFILPTLQISGIIHNKEREVEEELNKLW